MTFQFPRSKTARWAIFGGVLIACLWIMLRLPPDVSGLILAGLIIGSVAAAGVATRGLRWPPAALWQDERTAPRLVGLACGLFALSTYFFRPMPQSFVHYRPTPEPEVFYHPLAPWLFAAGVIALLLALVQRRRDLVRVPVAAGPLPGVRWWTLVPLTLGTLALFALAEINGRLAGSTFLEGRSPEVQFGLLVIGVALVTIGLAGIDWRRQIGAVAWGEVALVSTITLAALLIRLWRLDASVRTLIDEGHFLFGVTYFWEFPDVRLLEPMQTTASFPFIFSYGQAWAVEALGRNLGAVRLPSAVCGALTVPALYVLARTLFGRTTALAAALILAGFPPHLHYSRLALNNIADPLFGTWALAFIARGLRHNHRLDYALGGVMLGLTQYFYEGGRLFFPLLALGWLAAGLILWRPRPALRGAIVVLVAFALVGFPLYYTLISMDFPLIDRLEKTRLDDTYPELDNGSGTLRTRLVHFRQSLMLYVNAPENTIFYYYLYYGGKHPLILEYLVPLFFLGLVFALWRWRGPGVLPLGWVLLTSAGNAMLVESGVTARYVIAFPALALLVALGLRETVRLLWPRRFAERLQTGAVAAVAVIIMAGQAWFYFGPFLDYFHVEVHESPTSDVDDAILRSKNFPPGTQIHIVAEGIMMAADDAQRFADFLADDLTVEIIPPGDITLETLLKLPRDVDHAFYVLPHDAPVLVELNKTFGLETVELSPFENVPDDKELWLYYVPAPSDPPEPPD